MEASDGQAGEREEKVKWGWAREGGRREGPCRGWLGKAEKMSVKEEERGENWLGSPVGKRLKEQEVNSFRQMFIQDTHTWQGDGGDSWQDDCQL